MITLSRADVVRAIASGKTFAGEWHVCLRDGDIFWRVTWGPVGDAHSAHPSLRLPALFPEGERSRYCYFCLWVRKDALMTPARRDELLSYALGTPSRANATGDAYAASCIIAHLLTPNERARWNQHLRAQVSLFADNCLVALNDCSKRARFCYSQSGSQSG